MSLVVSIAPQPDANAAPSRAMLLRNFALTTPQQKGRLTSAKPSPAAPKSSRTPRASIIPSAPFTIYSPISPRRASVLAYISSLLLRTLRAIDYDNDRFPETDGAASPQDAAADQSSAECAPRRTVQPGKDPLPDTAEEFATAALSRKPGYVNLLIGVPSQRM
jgi:hypothetical protein